MLLVIKEDPGLKNIAMKPIANPMKIVIVFIAWLYTTKLQQADYRNL